MWVVMMVAWWVFLRGEKRVVQLAVQKAVMKVDMLADSLDLRTVERWAH